MLYQGANLGTPHCVICSCLVVMGHGVLVGVLTKSVSQDMVAVGSPREHSGKC